MHRKQYALLALIAFISALVAGFAAYYIMQSYYEKHSVWVEQAAFLQYPSLDYLENINHYGRWPVIYDAFAKGERHALQISVLGLIYPKLLGWPHAHLFIVIPLMFVFLCLFSITVYKTTGSFIYSVSSIFLFLSLSQLLSEKWGIGAGFSDYQSFFLLGSATLCLINAFRSRSMKWIRLFALFSTLSLIARSTSLFYALVIEGPIFIGLLITKYLETKSVKFILKLLINVLIITTPLVLVIKAQFSSLWWYYTSGFAWNLKYPFFKSIESIFLLLSNYMGWGIIFFITILFLLNNFHGKLKFKSATVSLSLLWWAGGFLFFLLMNGYISDMPKEVIYVIPPIYLLALIPIFQVPKRKVSYIKSISFVIIIYSLIFFIFNLQNTYNRTLKTDKTDQMLRQSQLDMADMLVKLPKGTVWQSYSYYDWGIPASVLTYYKFGNFRKAYNGLFFNTKSYWNALYPHLDTSQIKQNVYENTLKLIDVAIVLPNIGEKPINMEDYSYSIAAYVSDRIHTDKNWLFYKELSGKPYVEKLEVFINKSRNSKNNILF